MALSVFFGIFGVITAAAITVIIIATKSKQKKIAYSSSSSVHHNGVEYRYDPETKSIVESTSNSSINILRKRGSSTSCITNDKQSEKSLDKTGTKEVQVELVDINQNINCNNFSAESVHVPMSVEEKVIQYLDKNIPASKTEFSENLNPLNFEVSSDSGSSNWSNLSSEKPTDDSKKAYKKRVYKSLKEYVFNKLKENCEEHFAENSSNSDASSTSDLSATTNSSWSSTSSENSADNLKKAYKKKLHRSLKKLVKNMNSQSKTPSEGSSTVIPGDQEVCICKKYKVNTRMQPCNHCYLCADCAVTIFRLYKKCKVCRANVESFVVV